MGGSQSRWLSRESKIDREKREVDLTRKHLQL